MRGRIFVVVVALAASGGAQELGNRIYEAFTGRFHCSGQWNDFTFQMSPGTDPLGFSDPSEPSTAVVRFSFRQSLTSVSTAAFVLRGSYDAKTGHFKLEPWRWAGPKPPGFEIMGLEGTFDAANRKMTVRPLTPQCDAVVMVAGGEKLPPLPDGGTTAVNTPMPSSHGRPELGVSPVNLTNLLILGAPTPALEYWMASWSEPAGTVHSGSPIDESVELMKKGQYGCVGSARVNWDASGTRGTANDAVSVNERYVVECVGNCRGILYQPNAPATVTHFGLATPLPTFAIKAVNLGGRAFQWSFLRKENTPPPPVIYIHRWEPLTGRGPLDPTPAELARRQAAAPPCRAPVRK